MYRVPSIHYLCGSDPGSVVLSLAAGQRPPWCHLQVTTFLLSVWDLGLKKQGALLSAHLPPEAGSYLKLQTDLKNSWHLPDHSGWRFFCFSLFLRDHSMSWVNLAFSDHHSQINVLLGEHYRVTSAAFQPHQDKGVSSDDGLAKGTLEDPSRTTVIRWWGIMCFLSHQKPNMWPVTCSSQGARESNRFLKRLRKDNLLRHKKRDK